ncbi:MAG: hypothetical protein J6C19_06630, partial [Lachnospiraceae bacterium]|nr:hypothetical protein [Lachnospiraceae bacterium]
MPDREYLELSRILIDFPLPYEAVRELHIVEEANSHSTLTLQLVSAGQLSEKDALRYTDAP